MTVTQLSVFLENRRGAVRAAVDVLAKAGVDIATLTLADTSEFGILRLVLKEAARGRSALEGAGFVVNSVEVLPVEVPDRAGALAEVLDALDAAGLEIEYLYAFAAPPHPKRAVLLFRVGDAARARAAVERAGAAVLDAGELFASR